MASETGGVKPFPIAGRMIHERERLIGMTDEERAWRAKWLKDQVLAPDEPRHVPEYWKQRTNIIRRFYKYPLDRFEAFLEPKIGANKAVVTRLIIGKFSMILMGVYATIYYFKYNQQDWTSRSGWRVWTSRQRFTPNHEGFPILSDRSEPRDYASRGFKNSPI